MIKSLKLNVSKRQQVFYPLVPRPSDFPAMENYRLWFFIPHYVESFYSVPVILRLKLSYVCFCVVYIYISIILAVA